MNNYPHEEDRGAHRNPVELPHELEDALLAPEGTALRHSLHMRLEHIEKQLRTLASAGLARASFATVNDLLVTLAAARGVLDILPARPDGGGLPAPVPAGKAATGLFPEPPTTSHIRS